MRISFLIALLISAPAIAQDYCRPTSSGKDRFPKTQGQSCPSGYFASGSCCEAFRRDEPQAFPKIEGKACPSGTYASGGSCKSFR
jgi:hypothetical protein